MDEAKKKKEPRAAGRPRRERQPFGGSCLATRLIVARRRRGLSVDQLAEAAGVSRTQIFGIEVGAVNPARVRITTLMRLQDALQLRRGELLAAASWRSS